MFPEDEPPKLEQQQQRLPNVEFGNEEILPEDLMVEILLRLPVRHLVRLRCVCKSWCALIDDTNFINRHYQLQCSICKAEGDIPIISYSVPLNTDFKIMLYMTLLSKHKGDVPLNLTPDLVHDSAPSFATEPDPDLFNEGSFVGVANGVVCFVWGSKNLGLWNPATREFKAIPPWRTPCIRYRIQDYYLHRIGLGFDCISNDFKILRELYGEAHELLGHEVYSLTTNSWKRLREVSPLVTSFGGPTFMEAHFNCVCYWSSDRFYTPMIMSFNLSTEVFEVFNPPQNAIGSKIGYEYDWRIKLYKDCLAFVVIRTDLEKAVCNFDVWVVTEFGGNSGIPVSWQHLLTIGPFPSSDGLRLGAFRMDGDVLFIIGPDDVDQEEYSSLYSPSTGTFKNLGIWLGVCFSYVESLFRLSKKLVQS